MFLTNGNLIPDLGHYDQIELVDPEIMPEEINGRSREFAVTKIYDQEFECIRLIPFDKFEIYDFLKSFLNGDYNEWTYQ